MKVASDMGNALGRATNETFPVVRYDRASSTPAAANSSRSVVRCSPLRPCMTARMNAT